MSYDPPGQIWFIFGEYPDTDLVDIADSENSTLFNGVPRPLAEEIVSKHNAAVEVVLGYHRQIWREVYERRAPPPMGLT